MFGIFPKGSNKDIYEGLYFGEAERADENARVAQGNKRVAELERERADSWEEYAKKLEVKIASVAGERDAGLQTIAAIVEEIKDIDKNPEKQRFFSDPENRLSRTNFFKAAADKREAEIKSGIESGGAKVKIEERVVK